jgi:hypothetical protein
MYRLLNDGVRSSNYVALNDWMMMIMNWKGCGRKEYLPNLKHCPSNFPGGTEENNETLSQDSR